MTSEWYMDDSDFESARRRDEQIRLIQELVDEQYNQLHGEPDAEGVSENTRRRESDETFYCGAPVEGYDNRWDSPIVTEPDAEFELLLSSEHDELKSVIAHHEQVFQSISALCILWQNGVMDANKVLKSIQNIVKGG